MPLLAEIRIPMSPAGPAAPQARTPWEAACRGRGAGSSATKGLAGHKPWREAPQHARRSACRYQRSSLLFVCRPAAGTPGLSATMAATLAGRQLSSFCGTTWREKGGGPRMWWVGGGVRGARSSQEPSLLFWI